MNRFSKLFALCAALLVSVSMSAEELTGYQFPEWNECDNITFEYSDNKWWITDTKTKIAGHTGPLIMHLTLQTDGVLCFSTNRGSAVNNDCRFPVSIMLDEEECCNKYEIIDKRRFLIDVPAGTHTIKWLTHNTGAADNLVLSDIGVITTTNTYSVNLVQPGSLGTEILYLDGIDRIQDVRCLKVIGEMNETDLSILNKMKDNLFYLDLRDAEFTEIPDNLFEEACFLHTVILPEGVERIGNSAFKNSTLTKINFPESLTTLGSECFNYSHIKEAILNDNCTNWIEKDHYSGPFQSCTSLSKVVFPDKLSKIITGAFSGCSSLCDYELPASLINIEERAFYGTNKVGIKETLNIPDGVTYIGQSAFASSIYPHIVLPPSFASLDKGFLSGTDVSSIRLESPSVVTSGTASGIGLTGDLSNITLYVPDFLVNYYKFADYWYAFGKIEGYSTEGIREWIIRGDLILDSHNRWSDEPNTTLKETGSLETYGTDPLVLGDFTVENNLSSGSYGRVMSFIDNFTVNGTLSVNEYMAKNKWYYISLPFNMKAGDITFLDGTAQKAIRYYNGANRAENGTGDNWVNCTAETVIPAGTGFIFQSSADGYWNFPAQNDESKSYMTDYKMFVRLLEANPSEVVSNSGWNLVGNPYQTWYNIHKLNFTAPITVRNVSKSTYEAYSIIDDDYALAPNQAFFVQCPEGTTEISFPLNGRQMTSEITSQNGAPAKNPQISRVLVDLALNNGDNADRTRVVLNQKASLEYETSCDASKFLSESNVAQLYTLDADGTMYAINERPVMDGEINLGVIIPENGTYSFSLLRNMADNVYIRDNATGETVEITNDNYEFYAEAGTHDNRFAVVIESNVATGIKNVGQGSSLDTQNCYNLAGQKVGVGYKGIVIKNGKKAIVK